MGRLIAISSTSGLCRYYGYDLDSNRTLISQSSTGCSGTFSTAASYTYNPSTTPGTDELTSVTQGGTTNYGYTSDGQVSSEGTNGFTWNGWDQLATATVGSNTITYTYDPTGATISRVSSSPSTTTNYLLGDLFETNGSGTIITSYTDGPAGDLASYNGPPTSTSTPDFLYYDAHGNIAAEADNTGTLTANHTYDPFGAPTDSVPTNQTIHRFVGRWDKQYDTATSLILMGARPYDPNTGRFLSVDPIPGGSLNNYDYAGQDPVNNYDLAGTATAGALPQLEGGAGGGYGLLGLFSLGYVALHWFESCASGGCNFFQTSSDGIPRLRAKPNFRNPAKSPGKGWEWRGRGKRGSSKGSWYNPGTGESLHPDLNHPDPIPPHYDWKAPDGKTYRVFPDGRVEPK